MNSNSGTVFAAAQLRNLKKESTAFVPAALKRKKPGGPASTSKRIDAAPDAADQAEAATRTMEKKMYG
ncbi:hypothetical protein M422DRAFT_265666 [Sphaerobolus stellatus SS14]|uniref:Uncharacterized protein n=1 Tax=Sphaerobolus stellatus (strain SS14) TaxID=990650 RepID=A0A0C9UTE1_SPHS4|nr:hypothetical protein M422DRAFT_265666 [Sphaerobolus stellatus SS14]